MLIVVLHFNFRLACHPRVLSPANVQHTCAACLSRHECLGKKGPHAGADDGDDFVECGEDCHVRDGYGDADQVVDVPSTFILLLLS